MPKSVPPAFHSEDNYPSSVLVAAQLDPHPSATTPELSGPSLSRSDYSYNNTVTIPPPENQRFPNDNQSWPTQTPPPPRQSPLQQQPSPRSPSLAHFEPSNANSDSIDFNDPILFPSQPRVHPSTHNFPSNPSPLAPRSASVPQPRRVSELVHSLGYNTAASSFDNRLPYQVPSPPSSDSLSPHTENQRPHPDPRTYYRTDPKRIHSHSMGSDRLKIMDDSINGAEWDDLLLGPADPAFSPLSKDLGDPSMGPSEIISPSQMHMHPPMSGTMSNFNSPYSMFDSPSDGYETSPLFDAEDVPDNTNWFPLFPGTTVESTEDRDIHTERSEGPGMVSASDEASPRSVGSPDTSPSFRSTSRSSGEKRSSTSGVRKRTAPLPPIVVDDPNDVVAMKRARNTLAARKSRAKKAEKMDEMEATIEGLKAEVAHWKSIAESYEKQ